MIAAVPPAPVWSADVAHSRATLMTEYAVKLDELARWCDTEKLADEGGETRGWLKTREPDKLYFFILPDTLVPPVEPARSSEWTSRFKSLRDAQAERLFELAQQASQEKRPSLAYELVLEAARENPEHKQARRLLGYVRFRDAWHTPFEVKQLSAGKVWDEKFGWLPQQHLARYRQGERYWQGRWISAADDQSRRGDIQQGWRIETDHYDVTTNHSLEEGVRLARKLEQFYDVWQHVFVRYLSSEAEIARRFAGRGANFRDPKRHAVAYFRNRDEYIAALKTAQPQIGITLGIYFDNTQTAYFFAGQEQAAGTLYHEATHQLFQESRPVVRDVGRKENFWIIEAIACYMESLVEHEDYFALGGRNEGRVPAARQRLLDDQFYVPLAELVRYGRDTLQRDPQIAKLYSQSAGLATFLMHADEGAYRDPLVVYLEAVYTGHGEAQSLSQLAGKSYEALDREYREFLKKN